MYLIIDTFQKFQYLFNLTYICLIKTQRSIYLKSFSSNLLLRIQFRCAIMLHLKPISHHSVLISSMTLRLKFDLLVIWCLQSRAIEHRPMTRDYETRGGNERLIKSDLYCVLDTLCTSAFFMHDGAAAASVEREK